MERNALDPLHVGGDSLGPDAGITCDCGSADQKPGSYRVQLLDAKNAVLSNANVMVLDSHFRKQNVTIETEVAELRPSACESEMAMSFLQAVSDVRYWSEPLALPERGCMTSPYGLQLYVNGKPTDNIHAGLDQRAPSGTPIRAVADGVVKIVREWNRCVALETRA